MPDVTGTRAVTNAVISPSVELKIGDFLIGYARRCTETQARPVNPLYEIGTVGIVEMVPGQPVPVTLAMEHIEIYGATFVNIIAKAVNSNNLSGISTAAGLSLDQTKAALTLWLNKRGITYGQIFALADFPVGFQMNASEQHPTDDTKKLISIYNNCWVTRYSRPIVSTGDLLIVEAADISAKSVSYTEGVIVTADKVEIISR